MHGFISMSSNEIKPESSRIDNINQTNLLLERIIQVTGYSEVEIPPDRAKITVTVSSCKPIAEEAIKSANKRVEYITQSLIVSGAKKDDINITESLIHQESGSFLMQVDLEAVFHQLKACQSAAIYLMQKLNDTVKISMPLFFHSLSSQEMGRTKTTIAALRNASQKATEMASVFGMLVGEPLSIIEESNNVISKIDSTNPKNILIPDPTPLRQRYAEATLIFECVVSVKFQIKSKNISSYHHKKTKKLSEK